MDKILIILIFFLVPIALENVYAESIDFEYYTGEVFQINYELIDANLTKSSTDVSSIMFNLNSTNGKLFVSFPKAVPLQYDEGLDYPLFIAIHDGTGFSPELGKNTKFVQSANKCTFDVEFNFNNNVNKAIQIDINHGSRIAGPTLAYVDVPDNCLEEDPRNDTKIQRKLIDKKCSDSSYKKGLNIRDEVVCISPDSFRGLDQRGYLQKFIIIDSYGI